MKYLLVFATIMLIYVSCSKSNNNNNVVNSQDSLFMKMVSYSNNDEIGAGAIAATKGSYDSVNMFGSEMVSDHGKAEKSLDSVAGNLNISVPSTPDSAHQAIAAMLQTLSGHTFDTTYINGQVTDHMNTLTVFQQELSNGNNQQVKNYAQTNLPMIQMHLQMAQAIQQALR